MQSIACTSQDPGAVSTWVWLAPWQAPCGPGRSQRSPAIHRHGTHRQQHYEDRHRFDLHPVSSSLDRNIRLLDSTVPSMNVIGLQGSQTPRHEPTPESFVYGPRRSLRLHFPHRLQRPYGQNVHLTSLTAVQSVYWHPFFDEA